MGVRFLILVLLGGLSGCGDSPDANTLASSPRRGGRAFHILGSDYLSTGVLEFFPVGSRTAKWRVPIHADSLLRRFTQERGSWIINRLGADNVQYVNENGRTLYQWSVGAGSNPQDLIPVAENEVWISLFDNPALLRMERTTGKILERIDLGLYADADLNPEATRLAKVGSEVWLQLQALERRNAFRPSGKSAFLAVNLSKTGERTLESLHFQNPSTDWKIFNDAVYVGSAGTVAPLGVYDGGIEKWSLSPRRSLGAVISEKELDGKLIDFAILSEERAVALISKDGFSQVVIFNLHTRKVEKSFLRSQGYTLVGVLADREESRFYILDRDLKVPSIRSFDADTWEERTEEALPLSLPPLSAEFVFLK